MIYGMYLSAAGGLVESAKADTIAHNLANASTPGFKRELMTFTRRLDPRAEQGQRFNTHPVLDAIGGGTLIQETYTDLTAGAANQTDNPYDFYIRGDGFFGVRDARGETYYTRAGNFAPDSEGYLTTADGKYRVLDDGGSELQIDDDFDASNIGVFDFSERAKGPAALARSVQRYQDNMMKYLGTEPTAVATTVTAGALEVSSVNPARELTAMINAHRAYEANVNMIRSQDSTLQRLISQVGHIPGQ